MKINISLLSDKPMYEQIEDCIRQAALSGKLEHNAPLPSVRQLAADANVSAITVKRAYADLEREGIIYTVAGKGTFIRLDNAEKLRDKRQEKLLAALENIVKELKEAGADKQRLIDAVKEIYKNMSS